ncbi:UNVERIFIED_CONTAM: hypothetical protein PYX00_000572 [Menopon gallinae]|uniref:Vacuolar protein sorting-associated protein 18 homolog n=1 Tax=Menopon gallinae TaxID=328185 RepID=A0AAW2IAV3_9NEOP
MFQRHHNPELRFYSIMANILDQYEEASQRYGMSTSQSQPGFLEAKEDEPPMFSKKRVNFSPTDKITFIAASSDIVIIIMANNILLRINLRQPDHPEEIDLSKYTTNVKLTGLYVDPTGQHTILSSTPKIADHQPELFYLPRNSTKLKTLSKIRWQEVTAVAWNYSNSSRTSSGAILLGTSKGLIYETEITSESDSIFQGSLEEYWKQVFDIGQGTNTIITGIHICQLAGKNKCIIFVTTSNKIYQFKGSYTDDKPALQQIFKTYLNVPEKCEVIESLSPFSKLDFFYSNIKDPPKRFGWLTGNGLYYGQIDPQNNEEILLDNCDFLKYPGETGEVPVSFALTEFHVLLLYVDHVKGISLLNQQIIFEDYYNESYGRLVNMIKEPSKGAIWAFTEKNVFTYKIIQEDRNVWQIYTERGEYELAKNYCKGNLLYIDQVNLKQAEKLFQDGDYESSAFYYSQAMSVSFEEIALKFLLISEINSLKTFLKFKLKNLKREDKTQITMVVIWLIELYLGQLGNLREKNQYDTKEYETIQSEFEDFMSQTEVSECIQNNKGTVYDLMATHGDKRNFIQLTIANQDFERVIRHHIYKDNYMVALSALKKAGSARRDLYYQFAPTLIQNIPKELIKELIDQGKALNPTKLLPALLLAKESPEASLGAIEYLEFAVYKLKTTDQALHNYLLSLYAKYKPDKLIHYLNKQGKEASAVHYDIHYALRLCQDRGLTEACVQLSALLGLWESAIDLALTVSVDLAIETANHHQSDPELLKRLWLKIAEHVVKDKDDIKSAMMFLKKSEILNIEDILPFFSDFVTIDDFKDAICTSLKEYNQHIQDLKEEMEEASKSAEVILKKVAAFKHRYSVIKSSDTCSLCELQLLLRPFYIFPCGHYFHSDCLTTELLPLLPIEVRNQLLDLQKRLNPLSSVAQTGENSNKESIKNSIDNIVANECYFCGDYMIESIDKPFILESEYGRVMKEWE